jgi:ABC-type amino acid transport substrate-binding protein
MAGHFPQTAVFPLTRTPERERQYQWLVQLYHERVVFMTEKGRLPSADPQALKRGRIAILRGSAQEQLLRAQGYHLVQTVTVAEGLRFVHNGMADAISGDQDIVTSAARELYPQVAYHVSAPVQTTTTWLGGSADIPAAAGARLREAMQAMRADGSYAQILRKYGLPAGS